MIPHLPSAGEIDAGSEPIADGEILYRRLSATQLPSREQPLPPVTFEPHDDDDDGICLARAKYVTPERVAASGAGRWYYAVEITAAAIRALGLDVVPDPIEGEPWHCRVPDLKYEDPPSDASLSQQMALARTGRLAAGGPFPGKKTLGAAPERRS